MGQFKSLETCKSLCYSKKGLYFQPAGPGNRRRAEGEVEIDKVGHKRPSFTLQTFNQEKDVTEFCKGHSVYNVDKNGSGDTRPEAGVPVRKLSPECK